MTRAEYEAYKQAFTAALDWWGMTAAQVCADGEPFFSWRRCDLCARNLGGDRYVVKTPHLVTCEGMHVCPDCIYYAAHGRLDDETMGEVREGNTET